MRRAEEDEGWYAEQKQIVREVIGSSDHAEDSVNPDAGKAAGSGGGGDARLTIGEERENEACMLKMMRGLWRMHARHCLGDDKALPEMPPEHDRMGLSRWFSAWEDEIYDLRVKYHLIEDARWKSSQWRENGPKTSHETATAVIPPELRDEVCAKYQVIHNARVADELLKTGGKSSGTKGKGPAHSAAGDENDDETEERQGTAAASSSSAAAGMVMVASKGPHPRSDAASNADNMNATSSTSSVSKNKTYVRNKPGKGWNLPHFVHQVISDDLTEMVHKFLQDLNLDQLTVRKDNDGALPRDKERSFLDIFTISFLVVARGGIFWRTQSTIIPRTAVSRPAILAQSHGFSRASVTERIHRSRYRVVR